MYNLLLQVIALLIIPIQPLYINDEPHRCLSKKYLALNLIEYCGRYNQNIWITIFIIFKHRPYCPYECPWDLFYLTPSPEPGYVSSRKFRTFVNVVFGDYSLFCLYY